MPRPARQVVPPIHDADVAHAADDQVTMTAHPQGQACLQAVLDRFVDSHERDWNGDGEIAACLDDIARVVNAPPRGLDVADVPAAWRTALLRAGLPLSPQGELRWGRDLAPDTGAVSSVAADGRLLLPREPGLLAAADGVALKAVRRWVGERLGCRLQAAPGIGFLLWPNLAVLVSTHVLPLAGFLHGPGQGQRHVLSFEPGQALLVRFV